MNQIMRSMASISSNDTGRIKLFQLRAFVAVAGHRSFSEAALQLGLTQSSVSHAIATLETELGVQLLSRGRHGAILTPIGEQLVIDAQQILQLLETLIQKAKVARGLEGGAVRLASLRSIATYLVPNLIATFNQVCPRIRISLTQYFYNAEIQEVLRSGAADIGFLELPLSSEFTTLEMLVDEYVVLLPPSAPVTNPLTWEQLSHYPLIMPDLAYEGSLLLQQHLKPHAASLNVAYEINEDSIQVGMVQQGLGAAILPHLAAMPIPSGIQVHSLPEPFRRRLGAAIVVDALQTPATFAFWELLSGKPLHVA
jgi:DNA-binding transcriptional LysR family regulator